MKTLQYIFSIVLIFFFIGCGLTSTKKNDRRVDNTPVDDGTASSDSDSRNTTDKVAPTTISARWTLVQKLDGEYLRDIHFSSASVGYIVGGADWEAAGVPLLAKTVDGGKTWTKGAFPKDFDWVNWAMAIDCEDDNICYAAARHGTILKTQDGGNSWVRANSSYAGWVHAIAATKKDHGVLAGGTCWDPAYPTTANFLRIANAFEEPFQVELVHATEHYYCNLMNDITCPEPGICFAATTGGGQVIHTSDNGATWGPPIPEAYWKPMSWYGIGCTDASHCWAAGHIYIDEMNATTNTSEKVLYGGLERTVDGGVTWEQLLPEGASELKNLRFWDVKMIDQEHGYAVGCQGDIDDYDRCQGEGVVFKTEDGKSWNRMENFTTGDLMNVYPKGVDDVYVIEWDGKIWHYGTP